MNVNSGIKFDANLVNIDSVMDNCFCKKAIFYHGYKVNCLCE